MYSYYTTNYNGRTVHIIKALADANHDVQVSVVANRYDESPLTQLASNFHDYTLEAQGFARIGVINAGLFFPSGPYVYTNGIEKVNWDLHENDDSTLDGVMSLAHYGGDSNLPIIQLQSESKASVNGYRGAITGAFGLIRNGVNSQGNTTLLGSYNSLSGRAIAGVGWDNSIYFIATPGVTGSSGLTGAQCLDLVKNVLGLKDAMAFDGGGSVSLIFDNLWKVSTSRLIKSVLCLYVKQKSPDPDPDPTPGAGLTYTRNMYVPMFTHKWPHMIMANGNLVPIIDIKIKRNGVLVSLNDLKKGGN